MHSHKLTSSELQLLRQALDADCQTTNIRLRKGEYQHSLAEVIASFQLKLYLPNVKEIIAKLFGEEKINDTQLIRKIQTILKKMEKGNVVKIIPKRKPWELQKYMLLSFKFQDVDKNPVSFATDEQINQSRELLSSIFAEQNGNKLVGRKFNIKILVSMLTLILSYGIIIWNLLLPITNPFIFMTALLIALISSLILGKALA